MVVVGARRARAASSPSVVGRARRRACPAPATPSRRCGPTPTTTLPTAAPPTTTTAITTSATRRARRAARPNARRVTTPPTRRSRRLRRRLSELTVSAGIFGRRVCGLERGIRHDAECYWTTRANLGAQPAVPAALAFSARAGPRSRSVRRSRRRRPPRCACRAGGRGPRSTRRDRAREPLERFVDQRDDSRLVHLVLLVLSRQRTRHRTPCGTTP